MTSIASQITSLTVVYSTVYSDADQRKYQSSASLAFVGGIHRGPVNSPHKGPVTRKMFPFDDVVMCLFQRGGAKDAKKSVRVPPNNLNKTTNKPSYKNVTILHISPSENIHTFFLFTHSIDNTLLIYGQCLGSFRNQTLTNTGYGELPHQNRFCESVTSILFWHMMNMRTSTEYLPIVYTIRNITL